MLFDQWSAAESVAVGVVFEEAGWLGLLDCTRWYKNLSKEVVSSPFCEDLRK